MLALIKHILNSITNIIFAFFKKIIFIYTQNLKW